MEIELGHCLVSIIALGLASGTPVPFARSGPRSLFLSPCSSCRFLPWSMTAGVGCSRRGSAVFGVPKHPLVIAFRIHFMRPFYFCAESLSSSDGRRHHQRHHQGGLGHMQCRLQ
ncbi:hypothetical protein F2Q69_00053614 [Brassica cretica]|uniref:Secreted protein n=1 Tax=Brassica cretica TaxID=69181 RepID=A0A8S9N521_BRACR|nr:hypothetical protein F2Q69_00053614 [Brassica cretica]